MTKEKRLNVNNKLMKAFTALDKAGLDVIASVTEYGTWSSFTAFVVGNAERALSVEMSERSEYVKVRLAGIEKEYTTFDRSQIETYLAVFVAVATLDAKVK